MNEGHSKGAINIKLIINNDVVERYNQYYFLLHPKAKKKQIEHPYHPSINIWSIKPRIQMNALKQSWKNFITWWIKDLGYENLKLDNVILYMIFIIPQNAGQIQTTTLQSSSMMVL